MYDFLQVTAEYSNAVLLAIMPHVSDFATRLDLPMVKPVTLVQVREFRCSWRSDEIGGSIHLINGWQFTVLDGRVCRCRSPQSYYDLQDPEKLSQFYGKVLVSESQAVEAARQAIRKLGYARKPSSPTGRLSLRRHREWARTQSPVIGSSGWNRELRGPTCRRWILK